MKSNENRIRMTRQRQVILEEIAKLRTHPCADEIYEIVRKRIPRISLGTVYRNLDLLAQSGVIQVLEQSGSQRRFDCNPHDHYHIRCISCGRIDDAPDCPCEDLDKLIKGKSGYEIIGHRLEFIGLCPSCRKRKKRK
jgi:Fur family ferric uptake transcriptional regulator